MAPVIHLKQQIAVKLETAEGTEATSLAAADLVRVMEPELEFLPNVFPRNLVRESFGINPDFRATQAAELRFSVELAGDTRNSSSWTAAPQWSRLLRACGFEIEALFSLGVTSGTITGGPIQHGEKLIETTSGREAVAISDWYTGATEVLVRDPTGAFTGNLTVTGSRSGATFTSINGGTSTQLGGATIGYAWLPVTTGDATKNPTATIYFYNDTELMILYGARGTVEIDLRVHDRAILRFTFRGIYRSWGASTMLDSMLANVYTSYTPPSYVNAGATIIDGATTLSSADFVFQQAQISLGNQLEMRESANGANGFLACVVNNREPSMSLTVEQPGASTYNFPEKMLAGTVVRFNTAWGTTQYNRFRVKADHAQIGNLQRGVVAQRATWEANFRLTTGLIHGAAKNTAGVDCDFILFHT